MQYLGLCLLRYLRQCHCVFRNVNSEATNVRRLKPVKAKYAHIVYSLHSYKKYRSPSNSCEKSVRIRKTHSQNTLLVYRYSLTVTVLNEDLCSTATIFTLIEINCS